MEIRLCGIVRTNRNNIIQDINPEKPLNWSHFSAEGDVEFKAILYIPPKAAHDYYDNYYSAKGNLKLYVRRVFISEEFEDLLPKYLNFLKVSYALKWNFSVRVKMCLLSVFQGLVDSDTLPLNVSREMLQQHSSLKTIKKKLVRKALDMIKKIAEEEEEAKKGSEEVAEGEGNLLRPENYTKAKMLTFMYSDKAENEEAKTKYTNFWKEFGKSLKLGVIEDNSNRNRLAKLLRFHS